jgi:dienelactone hydrolase
VIEKAVTFGPEGGLVGVTCEPPPSRAVRGAPTFLLFNVGIHHHVGPYRFNVDVARALAGEGFASLRFDLAGLGESAPGRSSRAGLEAALDDASQAMAFCERRLGAKGFVPVGFCSGVDTAHALAKSDTRLQGAVYVEGYAYPTLGAKLRRPLRLLERNRWTRRVEAWAERMGRRGRDGLDLDAIEGAAGAGVFSRRYPTRQEFAADIRAISARGTKQLFLYFGETEVSHAGQLREMLRALRLPPGVEVEFFGKADHILYRAADRARAVARIARFARTSFALGQPQLPERTA